MANICDVSQLDVQLRCDHLFTLESEMQDGFKYFSNLGPDIEYGHFYILQDVTYRICYYNNIAYFKYI